MTPEDIAQICHEANRTYCRTLDDGSQPTWKNAPDWQKESAIMGVLFHLEHPHAGPEQSHNAWLAEKEGAGWKHGPVKDPEKKEHPCCVPYEELPPEQQFKDTLFVSIVDACAPRIPPPTPDVPS